MRIKKEFLAIISVVLIYCFAHWLWTLPIKNNPFPYGETDSSSHFGVSNYMAVNDKPIATLPYFVHSTYGPDNTYRPDSLWYPPPFQLSMALSQSLAGNNLLTQVQAYYILIAAFCLLIVFSLFFLLYNLYGLPAATMGALMVVFSGRDIMTYLFGQWPQIVGFIFIPAIALSFFLYLKQFEEKTKHVDNMYLYITVALTVFSGYYHPQTIFYAMTFLGFASLFAWVKLKSFPFSVKPLLISAVLFAALLLVFPYQTGNIFSHLGGSVAGAARAQENSGQTIDLSQVFHWYKIPADKPSLPDSYYSFSLNYKNGWLALFVMLGIAVLLLRHKLEDLVMLAWLVALYVMLHLQMVGIGRSVRFLAAEAHLFYALIAIGVSAVPGMIKVAKSAKPFVAPVISILFMAWFLSFSFSPVFKQLDSAYPAPSRINSAEFEALGWMRQNIPEDADVLGLGILTIAKGFWMDSISLRHIYDPNDPLMQEKEDGTTESHSHALLDYSDIAPYGLADRVAALQAWEEENQDSIKLIYNKDNVRIYELEN